MTRSRLSGTESLKEGWPEVGGPLVPPLPPGATGLGCRKERKNGRGGERKGRRREEGKEERGRGERKERRREEGERKGRGGNKKFGDCFLSSAQFSHYILQEPGNEISLTNPLTSFHPIPSRFFF